MKVAIIGGGFTGLAAGIELLDNGQEVVIFERDNKLGGLATGFKEKDWNWSLETFYHHIFTNDKEIIQMANKVGMPPIIFSPVTTSFIDNEEIQLDSPISVLKFKKIDIFSRLWMGAGLMFLKLIPNGLFLEKYQVTVWLPKLIGPKGYQVIWEKLLKAKFGKYTDEVNMAWFWTRVTKRTQKLGYFEGGFQKLADKMGEYIVSKRGEIRYQKTITDIKIKAYGYQIEDETFDKVLVTTPMPLAEKLLGKGVVSWPKLNYLWGQTLILNMNKKIIKGYWMNILENNWPFLVLVEHTNMVNRVNYSNQELVYLGNYLEEGDERLTMSDEKLLMTYLPYLKKINNNFNREWIENIYRFKEPYAQPVMPVNYSKKVPSFVTKLKGVYIANMSMVYPFDRGTNYAVKMGEEVARLMLCDL